MCAAVSGMNYIYYSVNSGVDWTQSDSIVGEWYGITSSSDGTKVYACYRDGYIYYSTNSGANWIQSNSPVKSWQSMACSDDGTRVFCTITGEDFVYYSIDSGVNWKPVNSSISFMKNWRSIACSSDGTKIWVGAGAIGNTGDYVYYGTL